MTGSTFLNQIGLGGFDLGYLLIGMTVTILLLLIFLILLIVQIRGLALFDTIPEFLYAVSNRSDGSHTCYYNSSIFTHT